MTQEEFTKAMDALDSEIEIYKKRKEYLKRKYIESQPIEPKKVVIVDGQRVWLDGYRLIGYHIHPRLYKLNKDGGRTYSYYHAVNEKTMIEIG